MSPSFIYLLPKLPPALGNFFLAGLAMGQAEIHNVAAITNNKGLALGDLEHLAPPPAVTANIGVFDDHFYICRMDDGIVCMSPRISHPAQNGWTDRKSANPFLRRINDPQVVRSLARLSCGNGGECLSGHVGSRCLPKVSEQQAPGAVVLFKPYANDADIGAKLLFRGVASDSIRLEGDANSSQHSQKAKPPEPSRESCPPSGLFGGVGCFPLGAQIAVSMVVAALAWLALWRAMRPFGLIAIGGRDVLEGVAYAGVGSLLLWSSYRLWGLG